MKNTWLWKLDILLNPTLVGFYIYPCILRISWIQKVFNEIVLKRSVEHWQEFWMKDSRHWLCCLSSVNLFLAVASKITVLLRIANFCSREAEQGEKKVFQWQKEGEDTQKSLQYNPSVIHVRLAGVSNFNFSIRTFLMKK